MALAELPAGFVYQMSLARLQTADGEPLANPLGYYTVNALRDGRVAVGGSTRLLAKERRR